MPRPKIYHSTTEPKSDKDSNFFKKQMKDRVLSSKIPHDSDIRLKEGDVAVKFQHGDPEHSTTPAENKLTGSDNATIIAMTCHPHPGFGTAIAKSAQRNGKGPPVYVIKGGGEAIIHNKPLRVSIKAEKEGATWRRKKADGTSDSGSDTRIITRSEDRKTLTLRYALPKLQDYPCLNAFLKPQNAALKTPNTPPHRRAEREQRRQQQDRRSKGPSHS